MSTLEDLTVHEVSCFECNKPIAAIPTWLAGANVKFQCEECRQKHPRIPGMADLELRRSSVEVDELSALGDVVDDVSGDDEDEEPDGDFE